MTSQDQTARLLTLLPYLQNHPGVTVADTARTFDITPAQLRKDLDILWMCGLPGGLPGDLIEIDMDAVEGEGVIRLSNAEYLSRPMRFTLDEATSLIIALRAVQEVAAGAAADAAGSALAKLEASVGTDEVARVSIAVASGPEELRQVIADAIAQGQRLRLDYDGQARGESTTPAVDPAAIEVRDGVAYLQAWSVDRDDWRTYRLDRIRAAQPTGEPAGRHQGLPNLADGWFNDLSADNEVILELTATARWVTEYYPTREVWDLPDGGAQATFVVSDPDWLTSFLLRLGDGARVISPPDAGAAAADRALAATAAYRRLDEMS